VRKVALAVEVLDAATLARVGGVRVVADGLRGRPVLNRSGILVWLEEDLTALRRLVIDPLGQPYEPREIPAAAVTHPLTTVELAPRASYAFAPGITGLRGRLIERREGDVARRVPVTDAELRLSWLDDDDVWRDAPPRAHTDARGDFVAIARFAPQEAPRVETGALTVRLHARRAAQGERRSVDLRLPQGQVADPSTFAPDENALLFAWEELTA